jgi:hypothetical protein
VGGEEILCQPSRNANSPEPTALQGSNRGTDRAPAFRRGPVRHSAGPCPRLSPSINWRKESLQHRLAIAGQQRQSKTVGPGHSAPQGQAYLRQNEKVIFLAFQAAQKSRSAEHLQLLLTDVIRSKEVLVRNELLPYLLARQLALTPTIYRSLFSLHRLPPTRKPFSRQPGHSPPLHERPHYRSATLAIGSSRTRQVRAGAHAHFAPPRTLPFPSDFV